MQTIAAFAAALDDLAARIAAALTWLPPTLARVVLGVVFVQSGWGKLSDIDTVVAFFADLGIPVPEVQARLAAVTELVCGALLLLGLATRFAVVPLVVTMLVAIRTALWDQIDGVTSLFTMIEFLYIVLLVWLGVAGPGPLSLPLPRPARDGQYRIEGRKAPAGSL